MMATYLFYDIETTGLNKAFDQVLQFAAIRTDMQLQEIERYELKIKLNPDVIPAPRAMLTHHIGIDETLMGINEYEAIRQIHQWMNTPGTISLGYNTLGFDDEFLRFSFYRNLLAPYTHQYANQCSRMDLYPMTIMYYLFKNEILNWPEVDGKMSLRLEHINSANQFIQGRSHQAMVDVEVTLELAKRLMQNKEMWDYVQGYFTKRTDQERTQQLPTALQGPYQQHREGLMILGKFGTASYYQCPVLYLGESKAYANQSLWLRMDLANLQEANAANNFEATWVLRKKSGEPGFILPAKDRFLTKLAPERLAQVEANKAWLQQNPELFKAIIDYHCTYTYPIVPNVDIDASLYTSSFWNEEENAFCRRFHQASPAEKVNLMDKIQHSRLKTLALRIIGRNYPELLDAQNKQLFREHLEKMNYQSDDTAIFDFKGEKRLSANQALAEIESLKNDPAFDLHQQKLLDGLENYLKQPFTA